jgi:hypothetical protein
MSVCGGET